jgi:hypothetical protein
MTKYSVNSVVGFQSVKLNYSVNWCWLEILEDEGALDGGHIRWRKLDQGSFAGLLK